ncbi:hypothetical protein [Massilia sp. WF1]|uniref:hypothetical protein n=1 Tax=Massilia sp. WF1 TaxID=1406431 RepID=UPI0012E0E4FD|nr:hypothetical protein [Massilia sp. WF1]
MGTFRTTGAEGQQAAAPARLARPASASRAVTPVRAARPVSRSKAAAMAAGDEWENF